MHGARFELLIEALSYARITIAPWTARLRLDKLAGSRQDAGTVSIRNDREREPRKTGGNISTSGFSTFDFEDYSVQNSDGTLLICECYIIWQKL